MSKCYIVKIGIVGNYSIGKTSFLNSYIQQESVNSQLSTIGVDFRSKIYNYHNKEYKLNIWDTAGQEQFSSIVRSYLRELDAIIIMYDITDKRTFKDVKKWIDEVEFLNKKKVIKYIVGNKSDLENYRQVSIRDAKLFSKEYQINFSETSIRNIPSINLVFDKIIEDIDDNLINNNIELKMYYTLKEDIDLDYKQSKCCNIL